jgi:rubredoxin
LNNFLSSVSIDEKIFNGLLAGDKMDQFKCGLCDYYYIPEEGDLDNDIPIDTPFEDLPDDWVCPLCGAEKSEFEKV